MQEGLIILCQKDFLGIRTKTKPVNLGDRLGVGVVASGTRTQETKTDESPPVSFASIKDPSGTGKRYNGEPRDEKFQKGKTYKYRNRFTKTIVTVA